MDDFVHIPKSGGSTLRGVMEREYGAGRWVEFTPGMPSDNGARSTAELKALVARKPDAVVTGHHAFGVHTALPYAMRYITLLRDPISRVLSDFFFAYTYPDHRHRDEILDGSLTPDMLLSHSEYGALDSQCLIVAGVYNRQRDLLAAACDVLETCFQAVGVVERFDESMLLIAKRMGWRPPLYVKRNETVLDPARARWRQSCEREARVRFAAAHARDAALHRFACDLVDRRIRAEGEAFWVAFAAFQRLQGLIRAAGASGRAELEALVETDAYRTVADYLKAADAAPPGANFVGFVEIADSRGASGWALDLANLAPIEVRAYLGDRCLAVARASDARPDVARVRGSRAEVGFRIGYAEAAADPSAVRLCFANTCLELPRH